MSPQSDSPRFGTGHGAGVSRRPRSVTWLTNYAPPYRTAVWEALQRAGVDVRILLTGRDEGPERWPSVSSHGLDIRPATLHNIGEGLRTGDCLLVGGWQQREYLVALSAARLLRVPTILFYESTPKTQKHPSGSIAGIRKALFTRADAVLTAGEASSEAVRHMGVAEDRIVTGFNTIDGAAFASGADLFRKRTGSGHAFLYVGQLIPRKNVDGLLKAYAEMRNPSDTLTIVGEGPDEAALRLLAAELGVNDTVTFTGSLGGDDLFAAYGRSHTLVLPSHEEVWGFVVNEALASGLHAVVSAHAGVAASVEGMLGLFTTAPGDEALAAAMSTSRASWRGPIDDPVLLARSPERAADDVRRALDTAWRSRAKVADQRNVGRLLWITNLAALYRVPVWNALAEFTDLSVVTLARQEPNRSWQLDAAILKFRHIPLDVRVLPRRIRESPTYLPSRALQRAIRESQADAIVVDGWESPAFMQAVISANANRIPVVASYRSTLNTHVYLKGPAAWLRRRFFDSVGAVLTAGPASTDAVLAMGIPASRIVTSFNSVDVTAFADAAMLARNTLFSPPGHRFLYVGQLIERKNVVTALEAFASIAEPDDDFIVVGAGPLREVLESHCERLKIRGRVQFLGDLSGNALVHSYASAGTLVLPSTQEVWGLVVNEALACGLHVVVADEAGVTPSVQHMQGVFVSRPVVTEFARQMRASRDAWSGPIENPEVLHHTPLRAAEGVLRALDVARQRPR